LWWWHKIKFRNAQWYIHENLKISILPSVFHPGLFYSTLTLLEYLEEINVENKKILELGAGSGLISISLAKRGAKVTASDINPIAIQAIQNSSKINNIRISVYESDLFLNIPYSTFDYIILNPPYFNKNPRDNWDQAFYCGENFEFFRRLFIQIPDYIKPTTKILMILNENCDLDKINEIARDNEFGMHLALKIKKSSEHQMIFIISDDKSLG
jgi:release factor glutamine methyltransferase